MKEYNVVSFSGGKDSTAMLLRMLELKMPVDEILFCDTGVEFPQMYEHIERVERYIGRKVTRLHAEHDFEYFLLEYSPSCHRNKSEDLHTNGLSFPSARIRWCTRRLKADVLDKHFKMLKSNYDVVRYAGIAADEPKRIKDLCYPLVEWGWTEEECLAYCKAKGFDWGGLYDIFDRVSCWCCPLARMSYYRKLRKNFLELWKKLLAWQHETWRSFLPNYTADELDARFAMEDEWEQQGRNWHSREFMKAFRARQNGIEQMEMFV